MNKNNVRIDLRDSDNNIHEVYITTTGELVIWTMDKSGRTSHKSYGTIDPMHLYQRAGELALLARQLLKDEES